MREGDAAAGWAAATEALDRIEFCSDDVLRMAMVSAAGLEARGGRGAARAHLGDEAAARPALTHAELLVARVRACAEDGGPLEQAFLVNAEADHAAPSGRDDPARYAAAAAAWASSAALRAARRALAPAEALVAGGGREAAARRVASAQDHGAARRDLAGRRVREPSPAAGAAARRRPTARGEGPTTSLFGLRRASARSSRWSPRARRTARLAGSSTWPRRPRASTSRGSSPSSTCARAPRRRGRTPARVRRCRLIGTGGRRLARREIAVTPSRVASSADADRARRRPGSRPGRPSSAAHSASSGTRPGAQTSVATPGKRRARPLNTCRSRPPRTSVWWRIAMPSPSSRAR